MTALNRSTLPIVVAAVALFAAFILVFALNPKSQSPTAVLAESAPEGLSSTKSLEVDESDYYSDFESKLEEQRENTLEALARQDPQVIASLNRGQPVNTDLISQNQTTSVFRHVTHDAAVITGDYESGQSMHLINYREIITVIKDGEIVSSSIAKEVKDMTKTVRFTQDQKSVIAAALDLNEVKTFLEENEGKNIWIGYAPGAPGGTVTVSLQNLDDDTRFGAYVDPETLKTYGTFP